MDYSFKYFNGRQDTAKARKCCEVGIWIGRYNEENIIDFTGHTGRNVVI